MMVLDECMKKQMLMSICGVDPSASLNVVWIRASLVWWSWRSKHPPPMGLSCFHRRPPLHTTLSSWSHPNSSPLKGSCLPPLGNAGGGQIGLRTRRVSRRPKKAETGKPNYQRCARQKRLIVYYISKRDSERKEYFYLIYLSWETKPCLEL